MPLGVVFVQRRQAYANFQPILVRLQGLGAFSFGVLQVANPVVADRQVALPLGVGRRRLELTPHQALQGLIRAHSAGGFTDSLLRVAQKNMIFWVVRFVANRTQHRVQSGPTVRLAELLEHRQVTGPLGSLGIVRLRSGGGGALLPGCRQDGFFRLACLQVFECRLV